MVEEREQWPRGYNPLSRSDLNENETTVESEEETLLDRLMTEGDSLNSVFQMTTAAVIVACTVSMAIETDHCHGCAFWWWWNTFVLIYFCVEIGIRISYSGIRFFCCSEESHDCFWNYFDFVIVLICIAAQWLEPLVDNQGSSGFEILRIFRIFRILRTLRVLRIFRSFTQLNILAAGMMQSLTTVFWIMVLMVTMMLIFAIFLTDVAGNQAKRAVKHGDLFFQNKEDIEIYWGSVTRSLITLFQMLTLDDWTNISKQVYSELPAMWFVFFIYIFFMGFAMLSLLTGVVAEHMSQVSTDSKDEEKQKEDEELSKFLEVDMMAIEKTVSRTVTAESDGHKITHVNRGMTLEEFKEFLAFDDVQKMLQSMNASVPPHEADEFWSCLDRNNDGRLTHAELKAGFLRLRSELQPKDILRIRYAAERVSRNLQGGHGEAATTRKLDEINNDLQDVEEKLQSLHKQLKGFSHFVAGNRNSSPVVKALKKRVAGVCL